ncbi:MAG: DNA mismatch repair protein MutS [Chloroflexi bacterium]|nr:DNA mismatch repair protein MutS [Chloroflexota bacterium]
MDEKRLTPMLSQYRQIKARFPDAMVLFRLGDFYETFDTDAKIAARELELVLTSRSFAKGVRLPMAGVPHHHVQSYIAKLIDKGYKVALVEQLEDPKKVKRLVKRDVIRVITPGTVVEDALLRAKSDNYLAGIVRDVGTTHASSLQTTFGLSIVDISTGEFATTQIQGADADATQKLLDELQRVQASEIVLPQSLANDAEFIARLKAIRPARISPMDDRVSNADDARRELCAHFDVATLAGFGCDDLPLAMVAANLALQYLKTNQPTTGGTTPPLQHLKHLWTYSLADYMTLDAATRRNLELTAPISPSPFQGEGGVRVATARSLFGVLDHTVTAMGARLLKRWITQPLLDLAQIHARLDAVDELHRDAFLRGDIRKLLDGLYDVERLVGRIGFGNANARDLIGLKRALMRLPKIKSQLVGRGEAFAKSRMSGEHIRDEKTESRSEFDSANASPLLARLANDLDECPDIAALIDRALVDDPPIFIKEGGLIKSGYDATLDELRASATHGKTWLAELEEKERKKTGIKNLRVRYNEVFGFFIEVPRSQGHLIPKNYERRATITHAERYVTPELKSQETHILATQDRSNDLEYDLFAQVRREVAAHAARLQTAARILAQLDALSAFAEVAARYNYVKPNVDDGDLIEIREGRHPVVERFLRDDETFVPNDARLDHEAQRVIILTGPNMSGKSVFVRQVALIVLMAQIGSFVPASFARIALTDRIFTRVGASDDIAQGRSTFLVEMSETSHILRHATPRSLIVLDEVGRGTSTYDGISLAWAIAEEIHNIVGAKTLFATHYHELTQLESQSEAIKNFTMAVKEQGSEVIFLRQVIAGGAEKSFGIHVARLAGLPGRVVERAEGVLARLESERETEDGGRRTEDNLVPSSVVGHPSVVREERAVYDARAEMWREVLRQIADVDIANMTPVQALNLLNAMQIKIKSDSQVVE